MAELHSIVSMRRRARARLPRVAFDFMDGAAGDESAARRNIAALDAIRLLPRVLIDAEQRALGRAIFGRRYALPFGVTPIGLANLIWPGTDVGLARAAVAADIPYVLSTVASTTIETIAKVAPDFWFQLYFGSDQGINDGMVQRAADAGADVLFVTVDVQAPGKRRRDLDNGFALPLRPTPRGLADLMLHPRWSLATLAAGAPRFSNLERYARPSIGVNALAKLMAEQSSARLSWRLLADIRRHWAGKLVIKGVLHPEDARRAQGEGVDAIGVSNHGGRQLDAAAAPIDMLPAIRAAIGPTMPILFDSGIRTGEDIAKALALGANFVLLGRAFLYSVGALGPERGPAAAIRILRDELDRTLALIGCASVDQLSPDHVVKAG